MVTVLYDSFTSDPALDIRPLRDQVRVEKHTVEREVMQRTAQQAFEARSRMQYNPPEVDVAALTKFADGGATFTYFQGRLEMLSNNRRFVVHEGAWIERDPKSGFCRVGETFDPVDVYREVVAT